jgi:ribosomal protein L40E
MAKTESSVKRVKRTVDTVKCAKCGLDSPSEAKFCLNCGTKIGAPLALIGRPLPALAFLHFAGGIYLIITAIANPLCFWQV